MSKRTIFYTTDYSDAPLIKLRYKDTEFYAILDSGSDATLVDRRFAEDLGLEQNEEDVNVTYVGFGGTTNAPLSNVSVSCSVVDGNESYPVDIEATLSDLSAIQMYFDKQNDEKILVPMLIGSNALVRLEAVIDFENHLFSFCEDI